MHELLLIVNIHGADRRGHISQLEDFLSTAFGRVQVLLLGLSWEHRDGESDGEFDIVLADAARDDVGLLALDHGLDPLECLR